MTSKTGDVVIVRFPGAETTKTRTAVVLSSRLYHEYRPDAIIGLLTTKNGDSITPTNYVFKDWEVAGLHQPTAFHAYVVTVEKQILHSIGRLSERDRRGILMCVNQAISFDG
ncbi:MAG: type II toxin-antitoxin system PemK/MazF family toxin [Candidatus Omnitrophota bacterium]|jgi:mRNA interferase MazF|nr:MAG: type II toxin-antitoxin system PemK/MazF family toxin [Candidatus Omnitrophota bacterium]